MSSAELIKRLMPDGWVKARQDGSHEDNHRTSSQKGCFKGDYPADTENFKIGITVTQGVV